MFTAFIIWTTFICNGGELADINKREAGEHIFFSKNLYSSEIYFSEKGLNEGKARWQKYYIDSRIEDPKHCSAFMIQHEDISNELILKRVLGFK